MNRRGERFLDEGEDFRNYTYAKFGAEVLRQPEGIAAQVFDAKTVGLLRAIDYEAPGAARVDADTLGDLADGLGVDRAGFERTVEAFNAAIATEHEFDPSVKDGRGTVGITPPEVQLGAGDRHAAVRRLPDHVRDHLHVRRRARGRGRPGPRRRRTRPSPACARRASSSAGCSSTTTRAARG